MKDSKATLPQKDTKAELQQLWKSLRQKPPGRIVGVRSKVATDGSATQPPQTK